MDISLLKLASGIVIALAGWLVVHRLTLKRTTLAKRQEVVTNYLVDVYRKLDRFAASLISGELSKKDAEDINSAITDIQLFGSVEQINLAVNIAESLTRKKGVKNDDLINLIINLRNNLRKELNLEYVSANIAHLNVSFIDDENSA